MKRSQPTQPATTHRNAVTRRPRAVLYSTDLLALRKKRGLKLRFVSSAIGCSDAAVCEAEHGKEVRLDLALRLAAFYGRRVETLWTRLKVE